MFSDDSSNSSLYFLDFESRKNKEFAGKENEWKKEKAIFEQKIDILEKKIKEGKLREINLEKMNENLSSALNDFANAKTPTNGKGFEEMKKILEKTQSELQEVKQSSNEKQKRLENEILHLKDELDLIRSSKNKLETNLDKTKFENERRINDLENQIRNLQDHQRTMSSNYGQELSSQQNLIVREMNDEHDENLRKIRDEYLSHVEELKACFENEKEFLEQKLSDYEALIMQLRQKSEYNLQSPKYEKTLLEKEIEELKKTIKRLNSEHLEEIARYAGRINTLEGDSRKSEIIRKSYTSSKDVLLSSIRPESNIGKFLQETSLLKTETQQTKNDFFDSSRENMENSKEYFNQILVNDNESNCFDMFFKENRSGRSGAPQKRKTSNLNLSPTASALNKSITLIKESKSKTPKYNPEKKFDYHQNQPQVSRATKSKPNFSMNVSDFNIRSSRESDSNKIFDRFFNDGGENTSPYFLKTTIPQNTGFQNLCFQSIENLPIEHSANVLSTNLLCEICNNNYHPQEFLEHLKYCDKNERRSKDEKVNELEREKQEIIKKLKNIEAQLHRAKEKSFSNQEYEMILNDISQSKLKSLQEDDNDYKLSEEIKSLIRRLLKTKSLLEEKKNLTHHTVSISLPQNKENFSILTHLDSENAKSPLNKGTNKKKKNKEILKTESTSKTQEGFFLTPSKIGNDVKGSTKGIEGKSKQVERKFVFNKDVKVDEKKMRYKN